MRRPYGISFDLDSTLLDGVGAAHVIPETCRQLAALHPEIDGDELLKANQEVWDEYWPDVHMTWMLGRLDSVTLTYEIWRRALAACGHHDPALSQEAEAIQARLWSQAHRAYDDVEPVLSLLEKRGVCLAVITNGAADVQREKLRALGLEGRIETVIISGEVGVAKPDVAIFQHALRGMGLEPGQVWHVGDNLDTDVAGAKAAGLHGVWLNRDASIRQAEDPSPDLEIRSLLDLVDVLDSSFGSLSG